VNTQDDIGVILNGCLELLQRGNSTVESLIERYPEHRESLQPPLEAAAWLQSRSRVLDPDPGFVSTSKRRLVERFRQREIRVLDFSWQSLGNRLIPFTELRIRYGYGLLAFIVVIILVITYNDISHLSQQSLPGDFLYPVKRAQENAMLLFSRTEAGDAALAIVYTEKRLAEIEELIISGRTELLEYALDGFEDQFEVTVSSISTVAEGDERAFIGLSSDLQRVLQENYISLSALGTLSTTAAGSEVDEALGIVASGLTTLDLLEASFVFTAEPEIAPSSAAATSTVTSTEIPGMTNAETIEPTDFLIMAPSSTTPTPIIANEDEEFGPSATATEALKPIHTPRPTNTHRPESKPDNDNKKEKTPNP
jgi:hypothetical protein